MIVKVMVALSVVACSLCVIPAQAEVVPLRTLNECVAECHTADCMKTCGQLLDNCVGCCHLKIPDATDQHCGRACFNNMKTYTCKKE